MNLTSQKLLRRSSLGGLKQVLGLVVLMALLFTVWQFLLQPQYQQFGEARAAKLEARNKLSNLDKEIGEIENLSKTLTALPADNLTKLEKALPFGQNLEELLANMHKLAQQSGLLITNMYVRPVDLAPTESGDLKKLQLTVSLRGKYLDLLNFLEILERHVRFIDVQSLSVNNIASSVSGANKVEVLQINLTALVYYLPEIPESPIFPYGRKLDLSLFDLEQFKSLQVLASSIPIDNTPEPNPFTPR